MSDQSAPPDRTTIIWGDPTADPETPLGGWAPEDGLDPFGPIGPGRFGSGSIDPYYAGDEFLPAGWSPERVSDLQKQLAKAGWLNPDSVAEFGTFDSTTSSAFRNLLEQSNRSGKDWLTTLRSNMTTTARRRLEASTAARQTGGGGRAPTIRLSNPDDLRATFRQVARAQTGGVFVEDDQIEAMVSAFQAQEASFQRAAIGGGTVTAPPRADTFAATELEAINPGGATANRFAQMAGALEQIVGAP
ncbi:MAG: hypothetical protein GY773_28815 [Actinomycetia bacterium]|nr:hypothetical protein [Actinomycetes bacterium]